MDSVPNPNQYPLPPGVEAIPAAELDLRPDSEIDESISNPGPLNDSDKNVWFYWHSGYENVRPYAKRNIRAWYRRLSKSGWTIRVVNRVPGSALNVANFIDIHDPATVPLAFSDGTLSGQYAAQHTSDLVRFPLLLHHGGVYADVGMIQIGDLDGVWNETLGNDQSPYEVLSYNVDGADGRCLMNYFLASRRNNPFFDRCNRLLLALWAADGGKTTTDGMRKSPLLKNCPLIGDDTLSYVDEDGRQVGAEEARQQLSDYIIQGQAITMVMCLVDREDGWDGPRYVVDHVYAFDFMQGSQLINVLTEWNGNQAFELMSLSLPREGEQETQKQVQARQIVEECLSKSFGFKLAHGIILKMMGPTLGSHWRANEGSDDIPGTYAHWLRHGVQFWRPKVPSPKLEFKVLPPIKVGPLLGEEEEDVTKETKS